MGNGLVNNKNKNASFLSESQIWNANVSQEKKGIITKSVMMLKRA